MSVTEIRTALDSRLHPTARPKPSPHEQVAPAGPHRRWVWARGPVQASLDVYSTGVLGFSCGRDGGPQVRLIGPDLSVTQILAAVAITESHALAGAGQPTTDADDGITLTRDQLEAWARRRLSGDDLAALHEAMPNSSIPDAIATIVDTIAGDSRTNPTRPGVAW